MIIVAVVGSFIITLPYIDPPFTDQSVMLFFKGPDYLPSKDELTRSEIGPGLSRLLAEEREGYRTIFYLACVGLVGLLGIAGSSVKGAPMSMPSAGSAPESSNITQAEQASSSNGG